MLDGFSFLLAESTIRKKKIANWQICFSETSQIGTELSLSVLIVGVFGKGTINDSLPEALARACHSAGIEFTMLISKNLCSGDAKGEITLGEKKLFINITSK